jgi:hypothetical protein
MSSQRNLDQPNLRKQTVIVCLTFFVMIGFAFSMSNSIHFTMQSPTRVETIASHRLGEIRLAPNRDGNCRSITFDNQSAQIKEDNVIDCGGDRKAHLGPFDSISKRLNGR